jgi:nitrite reductase/ring-hydroxylating ferredoxin subunit
MTALQSNATQFNPNQLAFTRVAQYQRTIRAPLERVWENVLDWEHLPHLHASSFDFIELDDAGDWGWRTWSDEEHAGHLELCVANGDSYVARSYQGGHQVSEIWTTLETQADNTAISVEFYFPDVDETVIENLGSMMLTLYARLWDEDESMMRERHRRLQERRDTAESARLGNREALVQRLIAGERILFQLKRREYQLRYHRGELIAHSTICPHLLGPLLDCDLTDGRLTCPWHGYQFALGSGECLAPRHARCSLPPHAELMETGGSIIATGK